MVNCIIFFSPAFHYLTQKARLLGYETEVIGQVTETRRMVPPGLTCDFVNYFHGEFRSIVQKFIVCGTCMLP